MYLLNAWRDSQKSFTMSLMQVVANAGDGHLDKQESMDELREFLTLIDVGTMKRLVWEAYQRDKKGEKYYFDTRPYAFQDMVNELGRRLGYDVTFGRYKGTRKKEDNGFDGLWMREDGSGIVVEVKTNDSYSISMKAIRGYRKQLIGDGILKEENSSILIVYGSDDKAGLKNAVRGSDESHVIRLISASTLVEMWELYEKDKSEVIKNQIQQMLQPRDFYVLDNLAQLIFPQLKIETVEKEEKIKISPKPSILMLPPDEPLRETIIKSNRTVITILDKFDEDAKQFYINSSRTNSVGYPEGKGFVVLPGSIMSEGIRHSCGSEIVKVREAVVAAGVIEDRRLLRPLLFPSPSIAAACFIGGSAAGTREWKTEEGIKLKDWLEMQEE